MLNNLCKTLRLDELAIFLYKVVEGLVPAIDQEDNLKKT
jgi:hypothetical protein